VSLIIKFICQRRLIDFADLLILLGILAGYNYGLKLGCLVKLTEQQGASDLRDYVGLAVLDLNK